MRSDTLQTRLDRRLALFAAGLAPVALLVGLMVQPLAGVTLLAGGLGGLLLARVAVDAVALRPLALWLAGEGSLAEAGGELAAVARRQNLAARRRRRAEAERDASRAARSRDRACMTSVAAELRQLADDPDSNLHALACELDGKPRPDQRLTRFALRDLVTEVLHAPLAEADARGLPLGVRLDPRLPTEVLGHRGLLSRCLDSCLRHVVAATVEGGVEVRVALLGSSQGAVLVRVELDGYAGIHGWGDGERTPPGLVGARALATGLSGHLVVEEGGACVALSLPLGRVDEAPTADAAEDIADEVDAATARAAELALA